MITLQDILNQHDKYGTEPWRSDDWNSMSDKLKNVLSCAMLPRDSVLVRDKRDNTDALIFANQNNISVVDILTSASSASLADKHFDWWAFPLHSDVDHHPDGSATMGHAFELTVDEFYTLWNLKLKLNGVNGVNGDPIESYWRIIHRTMGIVLESTPNSTRQKKMDLCCVQLINAANRANDSSDIPKACEARDAIEAFVKIRVQLKKLQT